MGDSMPWDCLWMPLSNDRLLGFVKTLSAADDVRKSYEVSKSLSFVSGKKSSDFGHHSESDCSNIAKDNFRVRFCDLRGEDVVPYDGVPFIILSRCERHCVYGKDKHAREKRQKQLARQADLMDDHPTSTKRKRHIQTTKKKACPAKIIMKEIIKFPEYEISENKAKLRRTKSEALRQALENGVKVKTEFRIHIRLPKDEDHQTHKLGQLTGFMNNINKDVKAKLAELVGHGVRSVSEMKRHLRVFVGTSLFRDQDQPALTDAAYHPTDTTIRKHMYMAQMRLRYSKLDQENLVHQLDVFKQEAPDDNFTLTTVHNKPTRSLDDEDVPLKEALNDDPNEDEVFVSEEPESETFFFCHQTKFQRHLLYRYGNALCMLDATYRTTKYALPLFFLAVKTNVGFSVVGEFVVQNESTEAIKKGLHTLAGWVEVAADRPDGWHWKPKHFMTDFCEREIVAVEQTFADCTVHLCDFHREQSWTRWVSKQDNHVRNCKAEVLSMLRRCAHATCVGSFNQAVTMLKASQVWESNQKLRNWFTNTWLPEKHRWVWAFRRGRGLLVNTNNGLERQNKLFKYRYLEQKKTSSLSAMVAILVTDYLPAMMLKYIKDNSTAFDGLGRTYMAEIPPFLQNRPPSFVKHCLAKIELSESIDPKDIVSVLPGVFKVRSQSDSSMYTVKLKTDDMSPMPSCECHAWTWTLLPCKHMFAVLFSLPGIPWHLLPKQYRLSPFFTLDRDVEGFLRPQIKYDSEEDGEESVKNKDSHENTADPIDGQLPLPKLPQSQLKTAAVLCREKLEIIRNATYLCQNSDAMKHVVDVLNETVQYINLHMYAEDGLVPQPGTNIRRPARLKKSKHSIMKPNKPVHIHVPQTSRLSLRKNKTTKRYGVSAEKTRTCTPNTIIPEPMEVVADNSVLVDGHTELPNPVATISLDVLTTRQPVGYTVATVFNYKVSDTDIHSLACNSQCLTDQVIDAYLKLVCQEVSQTGVGVIHISTHTMTSIMMGQLPVVHKRTKFLSSQYLVGVYLQNNCHWNAIVVDVKSSAIWLYNSMGETKEQIAKVLTCWRDYMRHRYEAQTEDKQLTWTLKISNGHAKQQDNVSCGVFAIWFIEQHILGQPVKTLCVSDMRKRATDVLLKNSVPIPFNCPGCGLSFEDGEQKVPCIGCKRTFHVKQFCNDLKTQQFRCKWCSEE